MSLPRTDLLKIFGLLSLLLGLLLLDRSFANWRDDWRNFIDPNGVDLTLENDIPPQTFFQHRGVLKAMTFAGTTLMVVSIVLLSKESEEPAARAEGQTSIRSK